jgi:hypothetical protein
MELDALSILQKLTSFMALKNPDLLDASTSAACPESLATLFACDQGEHMPRSPVLADLRPLPPPTRGGADVSKQTHMYQQEVELCPPPTPSREDLTTH